MFKKSAIGMSTDRCRQIRCGSRVLKYPSEEMLAKIKLKQEESKFITGSSDLIPGVYEGGFKIWECSVDLCQYLEETLQKIDLTTTSVLEIGCGAGLPGVLTLMLGAKQCCFQDFNDSVLEVFTRETLKLNCPERESNCEMVSGSWEQCSCSLREDGFDLVLSSETIYSEHSYESLHSLLNRVLSSDGKILLAAKWFYFGVGGSVPGWIEFVESKDVFRIEIVKEIDASIARCVLQMTRKRCL